MVTIILNVLVVGLLVFAPWSNWRTGLALNLLDNVILGVFALRHRDRFHGHLLVFGLVVGLVELAADAWLVDSTRTLDYSPGGGPMLWRSPIWMPLAWQIVAVQFAVVGERLRQWRPLTGLALTALLGAVNIPYYEEMARRIHWWIYSGCRMISGTPYYIIVGEFVIAAGLALLATPVRRLEWLRTLAAGFAGGVLIFVAYAIAYFFTDRAF
ncbi:MAG TPA: hypothetical protein DCE44_00715 [Verrucomicrobiales bacterium]|nr:hypothetical protein [Verrucomicrobiales bacterium]